MTSAAKSVHQNGNFKGSLGTQCGPTNLFSYLQLLAVVRPQLSSWI